MGGGLCPEFSVIRLPSPREVKPLGRDRGTGGLSFTRSLSWGPRTPKAVHGCVWGISVSLKLCARHVRMSSGGEKVHTYPQESERDPWLPSRWKCVVLGTWLLVEEATPLTPSGVGLHSGTHGPRARASGGSWCLSPRAAFGTCRTEPLPPEGPGQTLSRKQTV